MSRDDFVRLLTTDLFNISEDLVPEVVEVYAKQDWYWSATEIYGDYTIACPGLKAGKALDAYVYHFTHVPEGPAPVWAGIFGKNGTVGASHGAELGFVWLGLDHVAWPLQPDEEPLAETVATYWTRFAESGSPNGGGALEWPRGAALLLGDTLGRSRLEELQRRCKVLERLGVMVEGYTLRPGWTGLLI